MAGDDRPSLGDVERRAALRRYEDALGKNARLRGQVAALTTRCAQLEQHLGELQARLDESEADNRQLRGSIAEAVDALWPLFGEGGRYAGALGPGQSMMLDGPVWLAEQLEAAAAGEAEARRRVVELEQDLAHARGLDLPTIQRRTDGS